MKRFISILSCLWVVVTTFANDAGVIQSIDSVSYAVGYKTTQSSLAGKNELMRNKNDFEEYIRGLEYYLQDRNMKNDPAYVLSYSLGGMEAVFMNRALGEKSDSLFSSCVVAGLQKVAERNVVLPTDTIEAMSVINRYGKDVDYMKLDGVSKCELFTALGVMLPFQSDMQKYLDEINPGIDFSAYRHAYATGMRDVIELISEEPKSAYEFGRFMAVSIMLEARSFTSFDKSSFIAGAKAALGLEELLIPQKILEQLAENVFVDDSVVVDDDQKDEMLQKLMDYRDALNIELEMPYSVDWHVNACKVASDGSSVKDWFCELLQNNGIEGAKVGGVLMALTSDETGDLYNSISSSIKDISLGDGYKWFCARSQDNEMVVGIMETTNSFNAQVSEASVEFNPTYEGFMTTWKFDNEDVAKWEHFTFANINNYVAVEINGNFIFAPKVNCPITTGSCAASNLLPELINGLFKDVVMIIEEIPVEPIE